MRGQKGFSLLELLVVLVVVMLALVGALAMIAQGSTIDRAVQGAAQVHGNVRAAVSQLEFDLRHSGLFVPRGTRVGGTETWLPFVFYASPTAIGFRADVDGGSTELTCTPKTGQPNCPTSRLRVASIQYYQRLNCAAPDGATGGTKLVVAVGANTWTANTCSSFNTAESYLTTASPLTSGIFIGGRSRVSTIEQVAYRYVASSQPPYGRLQRALAYTNMPSSTFPPTSATWVTVATNLTDFNLEYRDAAGATLAGNPLSSANLALVRSVALFFEGYDLAGPDGVPQLLRVRSEIMLRNPQP